MLEFLVVTWAVGFMVGVAALAMILLRWVRNRDSES